MRKYLITFSLGTALSVIACSDSSSSVAFDDEFSTFTDSRDERSYKKVTIGDQTWMAENLAYKKESYSWEDALYACPEGWHLPNDEEWKILFNEVGGVDSAGLNLKTLGWSESSQFWSLSELDESNAFSWKFDGTSDYVFYEDSPKSAKLSVRCIEGESVEGSSSSLIASNSSSSFRGLSSSRVSSSSSLKASSSSNYVKKPTIYDAEKQTLTDGRDGQVYKTVKLNNLVWMAENLNYNYNYKTARSFCYNNDSSYCAKYGRLYTKGAALDSVKVFSEKSWECSNKGICDSTFFVQGTCPEGWHLPNIREWRELLYSYGIDDIDNKMKTNYGWNPVEGSDDLGLSILAAGVWYGGDVGSFTREGQFTEIWLSTPYIDWYYPFVWTAKFDVSEGVSLGSISGAASVRCIKDYTERNEIPKPKHNIEYGSIKDSRDGQVYKTVVIGEQTWMAENLRFIYQNDTALSSCPYNDSEVCKTVGRQYAWVAAMDSAAVYSDGAKECGTYKRCILPHIILGICPEGWRIPRRDDWLILEQYVGGPLVAGQHLKGVHGWLYDGNGYDLYGFNAITYPDSMDAVYWSSSTDGYALGTAISDGFVYQNMEFIHYGSGRDLKHFVRCIKMTSADTDYTSMYIKDESLYDSVKQTLTDYRDNEVYKTVKIGDQVWMAENLKFKYDWGRAHSECVGKRSDLCEKYGRHYSWVAVMDSIGIFSDDAKGCGTKECEKAERVRGACPAGWHVPSFSEWNVLIDVAGGSDIAGKNLRSTKDLTKDSVATDSLGFGLVCGGFISSEGTLNVGDYAYYYTSTWEDGAAKTVLTKYNTSKIWDYNEELDSYEEYTVRCVKDED